MSLGPPVNQPSSGAPPAAASEPCAEPESPASGTLAAASEPPASIPDENGVVILLAEEHLPLPSVCACCLAPAGRGQSLQIDESRSVSIPYCDECLAHADRPGTRVLAVGFAGSLLAWGAAAATFLAWGTYAIAGQTLLCSLVASIPFAVSWALDRVTRRRPASSPHTARRRAVEVAVEAASPAGEFALDCTNARWARLAGGRAVASSSPATSPWRPTPGMLAAGAIPLLTGLAAPSIAEAYLGAHVRVINSSDLPAVLLVDGRRRTTIQPSSTESPWAGAELVLGAGRRRLTLIDEEGKVLTEHSSLLRPRRDHLLVAPGPGSTCFAIEVTRYGRLRPRRAAPTERRLLEGTGPFWSLPVDVDTWFAPNPQADGARPSATSWRPDWTLTGGRRTALRQTSCSP